MTWFGLFSFFLLPLFSNLNPHSCWLKPHFGFTLWGKFQFGPKTIFFFSFWFSSFHSCFVLVPIISFHKFLPLFLIWRVEMNHFSIIYSIISELANSERKTFITNDKLKTNLWFIVNSNLWLRMNILKKKWSISTMHTINNDKNLTKSYSEDQYKKNVKV